MDVARLRVRGWVVVAVGMMLGACGGDEEPAAAAGTGANGTPPTISGTPPPPPTTTPTTPTMPTTPTAPSNQTPKITGTPAAAVMQGTQYTFTPTGNDSDGDTLRYSIANAPEWASFDTVTGRLSGTPGPEHVGVTNSVVISVSDGQLSDSLAAFAVTVQAVATGSATLSWIPPTANTDGSPLTNLAGYKVYWGNSAGTYPNSVMLNTPGLTRYVVTDLVPGTWFFVATALNSVGAESSFSPPATQTVN